MHSNCIGPNNCPIIEQTADGVNVGRCWFYLGQNFFCPRHGNVEVESKNYHLTGKLTYETPKEIEAKLDELAYFEFRKAQGGYANFNGISQLSMLNWLLDTNYDNLYERGEALYRAGVRYIWDSKKRKYTAIKYD